MFNKVKQLKYLMHLNLVLMALMLCSCGVNITDIEAVSVGDDVAQDLNIQTYSMTINTDEDTPYSGTFSSSDLSGQTVFFVIATQGSKGSVTLDNLSTGAFTYTPDSNENGFDSFTFYITNGSSSTSIATVTVNISPVDDTVVAVDDSIVTNEGTAVLANVLNNDNEPDGDTLTIQSVTQGTYGTVVDNGNGTITYTPNADEAGNDSFTYTVTDGNSNVDTATVNVRINSDFMWVGAAGDSNWSSASNWYGGAAPGTGDIAYFFDDACSANSNCDPTIDTNIDIGGIKMNSDYTGTITQSSTITVDVRSSHWVQRAGTFDGGDSEIDINGNFHLLGGTFNSTSGDLHIGYAGTDTNGFLITSGTFNHNNGHLIIDGTVSSNNGSWAYNATNVDVNNTLTLYNFTINVQDTHGSGGNHAAFMNIEPGDVLEVLGDFTIADGTFTRGEVRVHGNIAATCASSSVCARSNGYRQISGIGGVSAGLITAVGSGVQTYFRDTVTSTGSYFWKVDKTGGSLSAHASITNFVMLELDIVQGTFNAPPGNLNIGYNLGTNNSNSNGFSLEAAGIFNHNNGTTIFSGGSRRNSGAHAAATIATIDNYIDFNNLIIDVEDTEGGGGYDDVYLNISSGYFNVLGDLTIRDGYVIGGYINLYGDYIVECDNPAAKQVCAEGGTTPLNFIGSAAQLVDNTQEGYELGGTWTINKDNVSDTVTLSSALTLNRSGQDVDIISGILQLGNFTLNIDDNLNVDNNGDITCGTGSWASATTSGAGIAGLACP